MDSGFGGRRSTGRGAQWRAIASAATTGTEGVADDLGALAGAIGAAGINPDDMVIVTTLAMKLRVLVSSSKLDNLVLSSPALAAGTVVGIVPGGLATGFRGTVQIESSRETLIHFESAEPEPIVEDTMASPVRNAFQQDLTVLKVRARCAWTVQPGAVAVITGADW